MHASEPSSHRQGTTTAVDTVDSFGSVDANNITFTQAQICLEQSVYSKHAKCRKKMQWKARTEGRKIEFHLN